MIEIKQISAKTVRAVDPAILKSIPIGYQNLYLKALEGRCSPRLAIKAKCYECVGFEDVRERVGNCTSTRCPVWCFRPYKRVET